MPPKISLFTVMATAEGETGTLSVTQLVYIKLQIPVQLSKLDA